jgi:hypothetical protein
MNTFNKSQLKKFIAISTSIYNPTSKPLGTGVAVVTLGKNPLLDLNITKEAKVSFYSSDPA